MNRLAEQVCELRFVYVKIAADKDNNIFVRRVLLIYNSLAGLFKRGVEELADVLDGVNIRRVFFLKLFEHIVSFIFDNALRCFHVCAVVALGADGYRILADGGQKHIFVGDAATHHAGVGLDRYDLGDACASKYAVICVVALLIVLFKIFLRGVERISVLHREFTNADKSAARASLVAELRLNLIYHERILGVAVGVVAHELNRRFLVSHAEHHARIVAVGEAKKLAADALVSARLIPERSGESYREQHLLSADLVHLVADYILDFLCYAAQGHILRIDAVGNVFHIAAAQHERVAVDNAVGGLLFESFADKLVKFHLSFHPFKKISPGLKKPGTNYKVCGTTQVRTNIVRSQSDENRLFR